MGLFDKIFGTYSDRELKDIKPIVNKILELEAPYKALSDEELKGKTAQFKERYKGGESLDALLEAVVNGRISVERLDESVYRILALKAEYGLTNAPVETPDVAALNADIAALTGQLAETAA